jgi:DNA repair photolyase
MSIRYRYKAFKTIINKLKFPDSWFWARYTLNPYSGCEHSCIYCDARSQRYYLSQDFEKEIIIKTNAVSLLEEKLEKSRTLLPDVIGPGGVCDAYQPIEAKVKNTRNILKVLLKYNFPINFATKSDLIVRDCDILKKIAKKSWLAIGFSINTTNEELARFLEPFSSTPEERFEAIKKIKNEVPEAQVGTYFMPIIPYLEDSLSNLHDVIKRSKDSGADFILFAPGLTLRDKQKHYFIQKLKNSKYNHIVKPLLGLFENKIGPPQAYIKEKNQILFNLCQKYGLNIRINRWIPSDYRRWNYKIAEIILNEEYRNSIIDKPNKKMRWAGLYLNNLEESIINYYKRGELTKIKNLDEKIIKFIKPYLIKGEKERDKKTLDRFL